MKLIVAGSSSAGNAYILESSSEILLLEAGVKVKDTSKFINAQKPVVGLLISHSHGDHAKYATDYANRYGINVYSNQDVINKNDFGNLGHAISEEKTYKVGDFKVTPFAVYHDVPCFGYLIYHKEMGTMLFVTDTMAIPYEFKNVTHWLFEANYSDEILQDNLKEGVIDIAQYKRIQLSHMSLINAMKCMNDGEAETSQSITLIHLSSRNSNAGQFKNVIEKTFGVPCNIAKKGLEIDITKYEVPKS